MQPRIFASVAVAASMLFILHSGCAPMGEADPATQIASSAEVAAEQCFDNEKISGDSYERTEGCATVDVDSDGNCSLIKWVFTDRNGEKKYVEKTTTVGADDCPYGWKEQQGGTGLQLKANQIKLAPPPAQKGTPALRRQQAPATSPTPNKSVQEQVRPAAASDSAAKKTEELAQPGAAPPQQPGKAQANEAAKKNPTQNLPQQFPGAYADGDRNDKNAPNPTDHARLEPTESETTAERLKVDIDRDREPTLQRLRDLAAKGDQARDRASNALAGGLAGHNGKVDAVAGALAAAFPNVNPQAPANSLTPRDPANLPPLDTDPESREGKAVRKAGHFLRAVQKIVEGDAGPDRSARQAAINGAGVGVAMADALYADGQLVLGDQALATVREILSFAAGLTPVTSYPKGLQVLAIGVDPYTGRALTDTEVAVEFIMDFFPFGAALETVAPVVLKAAAKVLPKVEGELKTIMETVARSTKNLATRLRGISGNAAVGGSDNEVVGDYLDKVLQWAKEKFGSEIGAVGNIKAIKTTAQCAVMNADEWKAYRANIPPAERLPVTKEVLRLKAKMNGWRRNGRLTEVNNREIYSDSEGFHWSLDTQHGAYEKLNKRGKHQGEYTIDGKYEKDSIDPSGGHDIIIP